MFGRKNKQKSTPQVSDYSTDSDYINDDIEILGTIDSSFYGDNDYIDDLESRNTSSSQKEKEEKEKADKRKANIILSLVAAILVTGMGIFIVSMGSQQPDPEQNNQTVQQDSQNEERFDGIVAREQNGVTYSGNVDGSPINGTGAILSFDYSYYTERDGSKVVEDLSPTVGKQVNSGAQPLDDNTKKKYGDFYQTQIDKVPEGTTYTLDITPKRLGEEYEVVLHLDIPNSRKMTYLQKFTTVKIGDRYYVQNFTSQKLKDSSTEPKLN